MRTPLATPAATATSTAITTPTTVTAVFARAAFAAFTTVVDGQVFVALAHRREADLALVVDVIDANVDFDITGSIGKRYRRQDEIGTPWCVTIDFDTIEKPGDTFTLRERDSMAQRRITEAELFALLEERVY